MSDSTDAAQGTPHRGFLSRLAAATRPLSEAAQILDVTARLLGEQLGVDRCAYAEVEEDQDHFEIRGSYARGVSALVGRLAMRDFGQAALHSMREGRTWLVDDVETDPRTREVRAAYRDAQIRAVICVPLNKSGRFVAAMAVHQRTARYWQPEEVELVQRVVAGCWESLERSRVERRLGESTQRLQAMLNQSRDFAVIIVDPEGVVLEWKGGAETITGWSEQDMRGRSSAMLFTPEDLAAGHFEYELQEARRRGRSEDRRWHLRRDGARFYADGVTVALYGADGVLQGFGKMFRDATASREAELRNEQLHALLREQDRRKDEFLATLAHELRNPLAPLRTGLAVLALAPDAGLQRRTLEMMQRQLGQMVHLIDDLLDLSRINLGKLHLQRGPVALASVVESALETNRPLIDAAQHLCEVRLPPEPLIVEGDAVRLSQVIGNLLNNAVKYTPAGGRIAVDVEREGAQVWIRVQDNGVGIAPEMLTAVFEPFAQAGGAQLQSAGGLGIGLSLVKRLVEMHGGEVSAQSAGPGLGTCFSVRLPLRAGVAAPLLAAAAAAPPPQAAAELAVLVVDDNDDAAAMLQTLLEFYGYRCSAAARGAEALEQAQRHRPDVVLLDIGLPDMDGYAVARTLRRDLPGTALIALTGWSNDEDRRRSREAGFDHHLAKPVATDMLLELLREIQRRRTQSPSRRAPGA